MVEVVQRQCSDKATGLVTEILYFDSQQGQEIFVSSDVLVAGV
jgi:hypothetical protein